MPRVVANKASQFTQRESEDEDTDMDNEDHGEVQPIERRAADLVRLALATENRRITLRRDDITKKVFGGKATKNEFDSVFQRAQGILRNIFGMELHELLSRAERLRADASREGARHAELPGPAKKKGSIVSSKQYILRSVLDTAVIQTASELDAEVGEAERKENAEWGIEDEDEHHLEGTVLAWRRGSNDQLSGAGILHIILALILVNGRVLNDMQLKTYLKRLYLPIGTTMPCNMESHGGKPFTIELYLGQLVKQSYLERHAISVGVAQGGQKRARTSGIMIGGDESDENYEWKWGTRAIAEIGEEGVCNFIIDFMENVQRERESRHGEEDEGANVQVYNAENARFKEKLTIAIGRAAGGGLAAY